MRVYTHTVSRYCTESIWDTYTGTDPPRLYIAVYSTDQTGIDCYIVLDSTSSNSGLYTAYNSTTEGIQAVYV